MSRLEAQQPSRLTGLVVDGTTGEAIGGAQVEWGDLSGTTGPGGRFEFRSPGTGSPALAIRAIGYTAEVTSVELTPGEERSITIRLARATLMLDSISVDITRGSTITGEELIERGPDLATALDGWSGIVVSRTGAGNAAVPQIRGSAPEEVLVMVDGFMVNDPLTGRADLSRIQTRDITALRLERGAQSARYGNRAISGVLDIRTRRMEIPSVYAEIGSFAAGTARIGGGQRWGKASLSMDRLPRHFDYVTPQGPSAARQNAGGDVYMLNARGGSTNRWTVRGSLSNQDLPGTISNPTPAAHATDHALFAGLEGGNTITYAVSLSWLDSRVADSAPPPGFIAYDSRTSGVGAIAGISHARSISLGGWTGMARIGGEARYDRFHGDAVQKGSDFSRAGMTASTDLTRQSGSTSWTIAPVVRADWWSDHSAPYVSGRVDARLNIRSTAFTASFGNGITVPVLADLLFREGVGVRLNPDLRPERVRWEAEAGAMQDIQLLGMIGSVELRGYYGQVADLILWSADFRNIWSPGNFDVNRGGGEISVNLHPTPALNLNATSAFSAVTYARQGGAQVRYRPKQTHSAALTWSPSRWRVSARWHHLGSRFTTTVGTNPLPSADLMTLGLERRLGRALRLGVEVRDLADTRVSYISGFPTPGRSFHLSLTLELP